MGIMLEKFVSEFAKSIKIADSRRPKVPKHPEYGEGIGPFTENQTIKKVRAEFPNDWKFDSEVRYPSSGKKCDLCIETPGQKLYIEIKMLRLKRANEGIEDRNILQILSPNPKRQSALTDISKLRDSGFEGDKAIVIYGYDYDEYPMSCLVDCFEKWAGSQLQLPRFSCNFDALVHPVHTRGQVHGWMLS